MSTPSRAAPQLLFDDGSRAVHQVEPSDASSTVHPARDPSIPLREYYEIDRLVQELSVLRQQHKATWRERIALQFPDELLADAPDVCWEFEHALMQDQQSQQTTPLVFCLGDTTYASCCPDVVAAQHLQADCIVHYGHACLSPAVLPVLYSFGKQVMSTTAVVEAVVAELSSTKEEEEHSRHENVLLVYEVQYAHAMSDLQQALASHFQNVLVAEIPSSLGASFPDTHKDDAAATNCGQFTCGCATNTNVPTPESTSNTASVETEAAQSSSSPLPSTQDHSDANTPDTSTTDTMVLGGLQVPPCPDWSRTTLLFVGQDVDSRPLQNMLLRFATDPSHAPAAYWTWNPVTETLTTETANISRLLNRRFYLIQKAKLASIMGILVANPSHTTTRPVVKHLQALLQSRDVAQYNFMVGKVNPHKLANFPEVDAYCLVACPEHAWLQNERRDYSVPILTPLEVAMALGGVEWGTLPYSLDPQDFLQQTADVVEQQSQIKAQDGDDGNMGDSNGDDDDDDEPYFNPVTGRYEQSPQLKKDQDVNLQVLPGKGQLTTYQSAAADFLKQRSYQGLSVDAGETAVQAAVPGQKGIASDYSNR